MTQTSSFHVSLLATLAVTVFFHSTAFGQKYFFGRADFPSGNNPSGVATGDFNGDGKPDLAVTNGSDNTVSTLLGNPDGTFATKLVTATGRQPKSPVMGDFNRDGKLDLALLHNDNTIAVFLGNGDGTFQGHIDYATVHSPHAVTVADVNGDGKLDLVVGNDCTPNTSVFLGNGDGTFQSRLDYDAAPGAGCGVGGPVSVGDLNGDGKLDLAFPARNVNTVSVLLGNGDGTFRPFVQYPVGVSPSSVTIGDFNRDGKLDLAVTNDGFVQGTQVNSVSILLGNGDGTFHAHVDYPVGSDPSSVIAVDFNGDGKLDLAVTDFGCPGSPCGRGSVSVLLGNGDGTFRPHVDYGTGTSPSIALGDFNGDGQFDLAIVYQNCNSSCLQGTVSILIGHGDGTFPGHQDYTTTGNRTESVATGDFNGDGKLDIAVLNSSDGSVSVLLGKGDGTFLPKVNTPPIGGVGVIATGDFNLDGKLDLAVADRTHLNGNVLVLLGNGDGTFGLPSSYPTGNTPYNLAVADFNGDGKLDLVAVTTNNLGGSGTISILLGNGDGTFQAHADYPGGTNGIAVGDFNSDGKPDVAVTNFQTGTVSVVLGKGDGRFQPPLASPAGGFPNSLATGDFNSDGRLDLAVASSFNPGTISVLLGNGDGTFRPPVAYTAGLGPLSVVTGDFNGDGKIDIAAPSPHDNTVSVLLGNGDGTFQSHADYAVGSQPSSAAIADLNGDRGPDLVFANNTGVSLILSERMIALFPTPVTFGNQIAGQASATFPVTVSNPGSVSLNISSVIKVGGDFSESDDCVANLGPAKHCTISLTFIPSSLGVINGTVSITDNIRSSPQAIRLTGTGVLILDLSQSNLSFGSQTIGATGVPQVIALSFKGNLPLKINNLVTSGDFVQTNNCPSSINPGGNCSITVRFTPTAPNIRSGSLIITDNALGSPHTITLSGTGVFTIVDRGGISVITDGSGTQTAGYSIIQPGTGSTTPTGVAIFGFRNSSGILVSETAVPATPLLSAGRIYAEVSGTLDTGIAIANPNASPASINFSFTDSTGASAGSGNTTIAANGQIAQFLDQPPFNAPSDFLGTFTFTSSMPVGVVALRGFTNERGEFLMSTLPVIDTTATPATSTLVVPHFADGAGWTTKILLVNPTGNTISGTVQFTDAGGAATAMTIAGATSNSFPYSISGGSAQKLATAGTAGTATTAASGSVAVIPTNGGTTPVALVVFSYRPAGITVTEAGVPVTNGTAFRLYVESAGTTGHPGNISTGIAVANTSSSAVPVTFDLTDLNGSPVSGVSPVSLNLPGSGQAAKFLSDIFTGLPSSFKGVLRITTTGSGISVVGLRARYNERGDFLITTTAPSNEAAPAATGQLLFPHLVNGASGAITQRNSFCSVVPLDSRRVGICVSSNKTERRSA